ncbi:chaperone NapD [Vibrio sp. WJH972]
MSESKECQIASLVLLTTPGMANAVAKTLEEFSIVDVVAVDEVGKLIILLETEDEELLHKTMDQLRMVENVLSVALVYHQIDRGETDNEQPSASPKAALAKPY